MIIPNSSRPPETLWFCDAYRARGWKLFPCAYGTKIPLRGSHGHLDATNNETILRGMFVDKRLNIALACAASGLVVVDVDVRSGGDETLGALERVHGTLPLTPRVLSGAGDGSTHFYFAASNELGFPQKLGDGIDIKHNGFVLAPPSKGSRTQYRWDLGALPSETPISPCPEWILAYTEKRTRARRPVGPVTKSFFFVAFQYLGWVGEELRNGAVSVMCPWGYEHSDARGQGKDSSSVILPPTTDEQIGFFKCAHAHCEGRDVVALVKVLSHDALVAAAAAYPAAYARIRCLMARRAT